MSTWKDHEVLRKVLGLIPTSDALIRRLFAEDESFRELCADYIECVSVLDHLRQNEGKHLDRIEQYTELRVNLEQELSGRIAGRSGAETARVRGPFG